MDSATSSEIIMMRYIKKYIFTNGNEMQLFVPSVDVMFVARVNVTKCVVLRRRILSRVDNDSWKSSNSCGSSSSDFNSCGVTVAYLVAAYHMCCHLEAHDCVVGGTAWQSREHGRRVCLSVGRVCLLVDRVAVAQGSSQ